MGPLSRRARVAEMEDASDCQPDYLAGIAGSNPVAGTKKKGEAVSLSFSAEVTQRVKSFTWLDFCHCRGSLKEN